MFRKKNKLERFYSIIGGAAMKRNRLTQPPDGRAGGRESGFSLPWRNPKRGEKKILFQFYILARFLLSTEIQTKTNKNLSNR